VEWLNDEHQALPRSITVDGLEYPVAKIIEAGDVAQAAALGGYRHVTEDGEKGHAGYSDWILTSDADGPLYTRYPIADVTVEGPAPLGYTDWELRQDADGRNYYFREPAGTPAERDAAQLEAWRETASVDRVYAELQLIDAGLWSAVEAYFQAPERTDQERAWFRATPRWRRKHTMLASAAAALGISDEQLDGLFAQALAKQEADR